MKMLGFIILDAILRDTPLKIGESLFTKIHHLHNTLMENGDKWSLKFFNCSLARVLVRIAQNFVNPSLRQNKRKFLAFSMVRNSYKCGYQVHVKAHKK